ncbi:hypothetical protein evm_009948 [Chilo suppressalis]|nr:hypothetical protein evm_009948 [Chilo suppressalis]
MADNGHLEEEAKEIADIILFFDNLFDSINEKSLLLRNINQDPLENIFGAIRAHGHGNTMPTAAGFQGAYKTRLINNFTSAHSIGTNCEKDDNFYLQIFQFFFDIESSVEPTKISEFVLNEEHLNVFPNVQALLESSLPGDVEKCAAVGYCSGWLVKNAKKYIYKNCPVCTNQLESTEKQIFHDLIKKSEYDNKTWLCYPSKNVFDTLFHIEMIVMEVIKCMSHEEYVADYKKLIGSVIVNFNFLSCNEHRSDLINYIIEKNTQFCMFNWIKEINKILSGKAINCDDNDRIKVQDQNYNIKKKKNHKDFPKKVPQPPDHEVLDPAQSRHFNHHRRREDVAVDMQAFSA